MDREELLEQTALKVFDAAKAELLIRLPFLSGFINKLEPRQAKVDYLATDGRIIGFSAVEVLRRYKEAPAIFARNYLHVMLHCLFRHSFIGERVDRLKWSVSCDIATEDIIESFGLSSLGGLSPAQAEVLGQLRKELKFITAERLSNYFEENRTGIIELERLYRLFAVDSHRNWFKNPDKSKDNKSGEDQHDNASDSEKNGLAAPTEEASADWKKATRSAQTDLEAFTRQHSFNSQNMIQAIKAVSREKYDYREFLRKFAVYGEIMEINDEEFDYIYYSYGMQIYGKMPLIEPLEYKDVKRIKDFVIAIDTSRSVNGEMVQRFVQKTYNILKSTESFFKKVNIHIIQCDTEIKEDVLITSREDFENYLENMELYGFGGTDFRPVFRYVDWLSENGGFSELGGLIYFTDGCGEYPEKMPAYNTAFVFVEGDASDEYAVPSWAMKIVLSKYELREI